jgi:hypothetical protein
MNSVVLKTVFSDTLVNITEWLFITLNLKENIFIIDDEKINAALGFHFPMRMVVIKLSDDTLFV